MSACDQQKFYGVNDDSWTSIKQTAKDKYGVEIADACGTVCHQGFSFSWTLDADQTLTVQCTDSPFFAPCASINEKVKELIAKCIDDNE
jgi:hypothetical protein